MTWTAKHQLYIYKRLRRMTEGDLKRLMIFMPPRHGKSELVTVRYAAWRMKKDPGMRTIIASYGQKLANSFSRSIKRVLAEDHALTAGNAAALGCKRRFLRRGPWDIFNSVVATPVWLRKPQPLQPRAAAAPAHVCICLLYTSRCV